MRYQHRIAVGPATFRIGSAWRAPMVALADLYRSYPAPAGVADFTVRLEPASPWRRWLRRSVSIGGDHVLPEAAPLPLAHGLLAAEMGMNLQMALGWRRHLLLHAAVVEKNGRALILSGASGSGKSTLAAMLAMRGWRLLGDEFALVDPESGLLHPFPRPISLKNASIALFADDPAARWGPLLQGTPKGAVRHLVPAVDAIKRMADPAPAAVIVFPSFGFAPVERAVSPSEAFVRLTQASTNYTNLGEAGFRALARLVRDVPAIALDYPDGGAALAWIDGWWRGR